MTESESRKSELAINLLSAVTYLLASLTPHYVFSVCQCSSRAVKSCLLSNLRPSELTQVAVNLLQWLPSNKGLR